MLDWLKTTLKKTRMESFPQLHHMDEAAGQDTVRVFFGFDMGN